MRTLAREALTPSRSLVLCLLAAAPAVPASDVPPSARLPLEARLGEEVSVEAWKTGGAFSLRVRSARGVQAAVVAWRDPPVVTLTFIVDAAGPYVVECVPTGLAPAQCELAPVAVSPASSAPTARPQVEKALRDGHSLLREWTPAATGAAASAFTRALEDSRALGLATLEVDALMGLATARQLQGAAQDGADLLEQSRARAAAIPDDRRLVLAVARLASAAAELGKLEAVDSAIAQARARATARGFDLGLAQLDLAQGDVHYARSDLQSAESSYRAAHGRFVRLGNADGEVDAESGLAYAAADLSRDAEARGHLEPARDLARAEGDRRREAVALRVLGNVLAKMTEEAEAIRCLESAQALFERAEDRASLVALYNGLGQLHGKLNDLAAAIGYLEKAVELARATGLRGQQGMARFEMAQYQRRLGRLAEAAASYEAARALLEAAGDKAMAAYALAGLGNVDAAQGRHDAGLRRLMAALEVVRASGETRLSSGMLIDVAEIHLALDRVALAQEALSEALRLARAARDPVREARALYGLARVARREGALDEARALVESAIEVGESVRGRVPSRELRSLFFEELDERYRFHVDLLMELERARPDERFERLALAAAERGRARTLLDRIGRAPGPVPEPSRLERERQLREEIRLDALQRDLEASGDAGASGAPSLAEKLATLRRLEGLDPAPEADAGRFDDERIDRIQRELAGPDTLLIEISLGRDRSWLWAVSRDRVSAHALPARESLERQAQDLHELLTGRQHDQAGTARERRARAERQDERFHEQGRALSAQLLGAVDDLDAYRRLIVVADGLLAYVPLAALPHPRALAPGGGYRPLVVSHEIVCVPSLVVLLGIHERAASRAAGPPPAAGRPRVAVLADPVFSSDDPRVAPQRSMPPPVGRAGVSPAAGVGLRGAGQGSLALPRLLASREEAATIERTAVGAEVRVATGFAVDRAATEAALTGANQVVHVATHGVLDDEHPMLSAMVASLVDPEGRRQDGFVRAQDVYALRVAAEVVVLSACETALGRRLRGEGITGLVHSLLHAGADSVVASKWKVDDSATQQLMAAFYRAMFVDGLDVSAALRAAQVELLRGRSTRAPFYWSAFEVHGLSPTIAPAPR